MTEHAWVEAEVTGLQLRDQRLERRLRRLMEAMAATPGEPIPVSCGDWAATKAAYRFFDNPKISESGMMAGHFASTALRFAQHVARSEEPVLILQDTTEFLFKRAAPEKIGFTKTVNGGYYKAGQPSQRKLCGLLMHASLAVTTDGVPLGLAGVKFWTRDSFKGTAALKRHINPTRVPIETKESYRWLENLRQSVALLRDPQRCIHVGDRESDIYELYCLAQELDTKFFVRAQTDRLAAKSGLDDSEPHRVRARLAQVAWAGTHEVDVAGKGSRAAKLQVKFATIETLPPIGKQKRYKPQMLTWIHAVEIDPPDPKDEINWHLVTNLPVTTLQEAIEKLQWYAMRWKIETFHKIMKSGCKAEEARLRTAERLVKFLVLVAVVSWRIFWLTMSACAHPDGDPCEVLTTSEITALDEIDAARPTKRLKNRTLHDYMLQIARLGGYLARTRDPPPGNTVIWRGLARLHDITIGLQIGRRRSCG